MDQRVIKTPQAQIDTEALLMSKEALTRVASHEELCAERWKTAIGTARATLAGVITTLLAVLGYLANILITAPHH